MEILRPGDDIPYEFKTDEKSIDNENHDITKVVNTAITNEQNKPSDLKDHAIAKKRGFVFEPTKDLLAAFKQCGEKPSYKDLARLKAYLNEYDRKLDEQPFLVRVSTFICRRIFFSAKIAEADQLLIKHYTSSMNPKERAYIDFIDSFDKAEIDVLTTTNKRLILPEGGSYKGPLKYGLPHGEGDLRLPNGGTYKGSFKDGRLSGEGKAINFKISNGGIYSGEVKDGEPSGYGYVQGFKHEKGGFYTGPIKDGLFEGTGYLLDLQLEDEPSRYTGDAFKGVPHGHGTLYHPGFFHTCIYDNGHLIEKGEIKRSPQESSKKSFEISENPEVMNLSGGDIESEDDLNEETFIRSGPYQGGIYKGSVEKDELHGEGVLEFPDDETVKDPSLRGAIYQGRFQQGAIIAGTIILKDGTKMSTVDKPHFSGEQFKSSFKEGAFNRQGKLTGEGLIQKKDGSIEKGNFYNGKLHGYGETRDSNGKIIQGLFHEGKLKFTGLWKSHDQS